MIVLVREFNSLSGDILDLLQVIPGEFTSHVRTCSYTYYVCLNSVAELKSCVFSFTSNGPSDPLYAKAIEER